MTHANRWLVHAIVSSALFLIVIDMTVLYTALPTLTRDLAATASEKLWILNAYSLVVAGLLPGFGTLGDRFGHRRMFVIGLVVFGIASSIAAFAPSPAVLIAARALLAVGAAAMMPATLSIIRLTFEDDDERAFAIGIWAAVASGGAALGPVVGGLLLEYFWWGSVFLINVPIVIIALIAALVLIPARAGHKGTPWDMFSSAQIMLGLVALSWALKESATRQPDWGLVALATVIGGAACTAFVRRQFRLRHPLIDLSLFGSRDFSAGVIGALIAAMVIVGMELALSQRLQLVLGLSPLQAAWFILPIPLGAFVGGPLAGRYLPRIGGMKMLLTGFVLSLAGLILFLALLHGPKPVQIVALALQGLGLGAAMTAASSTIMLSAPRERAGMAAAVEEVSYELGGALGIAVLGSLMSFAYTLNMPDLPGIAAQAHDGLDEALMIAATLPERAAQDLSDAARGASDRAFVWVTLAAILITAALSAYLATRARR
ncbi:MFS transporter [Paracoccus sp. DMF-8]|uniref:MFS transporter n=1 Tax=Paracoccus sp. DMF-8 TaxID=3019445 RepID=UPI0023E37C0C|nr:MFS transporter [Paracoccus sp. DMF-8]MDF3607464.1 MFS transporter [Paracoccus sp. DMF-8]